MRDFRGCHERLLVVLCAIFCSSGLRGTQLVVTFSLGCEVGPASPPGLLGHTDPSEGRSIGCKCLLQLPVLSSLLKRRKDLIQSVPLVPA